MLTKNIFFCLFLFDFLFKLNIKSIEKVWGKITKSKMAYLP